MLCCWLSAGEEQVNVFSLLKQENLPKIWIKLVDKKDWEPKPSSFYKTF